MRNKYNIKILSVIACYFGFCAIACSCSDGETSAVSNKDNARNVATDMAPLMGVAHYVSRDAGNPSAYAWMLRLSVPKVTCVTQGSGPLVKVPDLKNDEIWRVTSKVEMTEIDLHMGYSEASAIPDARQTRVVDLKGNRLSLDQVKDRLANDTHVLVSLTGKMPDPFYTQLIKPNTLVVLIGNVSPREFDLLPIVKMKNN